MQKRRHVAVFTYLANVTDGRICRIAIDDTLHQTILSSVVMQNVHRRYIGPVHQKGFNFYVNPAFASIAYSS